MLKQRQMKILWNTKIEDIQNLSEIFSLCLDWAEITLGVNNRNYRNGKIKVIFKHTKNTSGFGEFEVKNNTIKLHGLKIKELGDLTKTFIHEYTHYLQPIKSQYWKLEREFGYDDHPFEVEANENEKRYNRRLLAYIRKNLNK